MAQQIQRITITVQSPGRKDSLQTTPASPRSRLHGFGNPGTTRLEGTAGLVVSRATRGPSGVSQGRTCWERRLEPLVGQPADEAGVVGDAVGVLVGRGEQVGAVDQAE